MSGAAGGDSSPVMRAVDAGVLGSGCCRELDSRAFEWARDSDETSSAKAFLVSGPQRPREP